MTQIQVIDYKTKIEENQNSILFNVTSRSNDIGRQLSPFLLGPVKLWGDYVSYNVENAWQYSKVYKDHIDNGILNGYRDNQPSKKWLEWAKDGWSKKEAVRYPMGKGAKPLYSWWNGEKLDYIEARSKIYIPLYAKKAKRTEAFKKIKKLYEREKYEIIYLKDFDGYDLKNLDYSLLDAITSKRSMGHAFVIKMLLEWGENFYR